MSQTLVAPTASPFVWGGFTWYDLPPHVAARNTGRGQPPHVHLRFVPNGVHLIAEPGLAWNRARTCARVECLPLPGADFAQPRTACIHSDGWPTRIGLPLPDNDRPASLVQVVQAGTLREVALWDPMPPTNVQSNCRRRQGLVLYRLPVRGSVRLLAQLGTPLYPESYEWWRVGLAWLRQEPALADCELFSVASERLDLTSEWGCWQVRPLRRMAPPLYPRWLESKDVIRLSPEVSP